MSSTAGFILDLNRCVGCHACAMACAIENDLPADAAWREVRTYNPPGLNGIERFHLSMACNHCDDAPCMAQCPSDAYYRDAGTGAVLINADRCLGCGYCAWVCPHDAPRMDEAAGVMRKCTFCVDRLNEGLDPACVAACPTGALAWEMADPATRPAWPGPQRIAGLTDLDTRPALRLIDLHGNRRVPEQDHVSIPASRAPFRDRLRRRIALRQEWVLAVFTTLAALLAGLQLGARVGGPAWPPSRILAIGGPAMLLSAVHLKRSARAWRAVANPGASWLSREILFFGLFLLAAGLWPLLSAPGPAVGWIGAGLGLLSVAAMDRVYRVHGLRGVGPRRRHDLLIAAPLMAIAARLSPWLLAAALLLKLLDRLRFYRDLEVESPALLMLDDLDRRLSEAARQ